MNVPQPKHARSGWPSRLFNVMLLVSLILAAVGPSGAQAAPTPLTGSLRPTALESASRQTDDPVPSTWAFQGPAPQVNAQQDLANVATADEPVSGAVAAIAASPTDPNLVYIGAANGGVWKTTNATAANPTWTPLTDQLKSLSIGIGALALDPLDATGNTVIAGTGRFSGYANRGDDLVGIYHSTDGGASWAVSTSPLLSAARITGVAARGDTMLVASENGLFRTTGGPLGVWTQISGSGGLPTARAASISGDPANPNRLYAAFTGASGGLFRSDDLGATWTNITGGLSAVISGDTDAFDVAVSHDGSVVTVLLTGTVSGAPGNAPFRSVNGGAFTALDLPFVFDRAYGKFGIAADPTNPNLVYVSGGYMLTGSNPFLATTHRVDASQPSGSQLTHLYSAVSTETVAAMSATQTYMYVRSTASLPKTPPYEVMVESEKVTVTAVTMPSWYYRLAIVRGVGGTTAATHPNYSMVASGAAYGAPHVDINTLAMDASGGLLMGAHGGIFLLPDPDSASTTSNTWLSKNGNLGVSEMHDVAYDHVTDTLVGSNQDNCVVYQSAPGSLIWPVAPGYSGDGGDVAVADLGGGQSVRYASNQNLGSFQRQVYNTSNTLVSKTDLSTSVITDKQFTTPVVVNTVDPNRLLIGGSANLYESLDQGTTINKIATVGVNYRAIAYGGRKNGVANPDIFYVANGTNTFYARTTAGGAVAATGALPSGAWYIRDIVMNPADWMNVFAVDDNQVFASNDAGATWSDITGNLLSVSSAEISTIEFVQAPSPYIAVGTRSGVFGSSLAALGSWRELGEALPDVLVYELAYDATDDVLAAGTLGRGAWLLAGASTSFALPPVAPILTLSGAVAANEGATLTFNFAVNDPGDSFTVSTLTIGAGGSLAPGSLVTTAAGGSFQVYFPDGPGTVSIDLQVTDSTTLTSNLASTSVTVSNVKPTTTIVGAPTSGSPGTPINLTSTVTDPSPTDTAAGFVYSWLVQKYVNNVFVGNYATGSAATLSYTPDVAGKYNVFFKAQDKDGLWSSYATKTIYAASPDLAVDAFEVTVNEALTAQNTGAFAHKGPAPLALSASVGGIGVIQTLFYDDFEAEPLAGSTTTLSQWDLTPGNVSVYGPGGSDPLPGNGRYVDLMATAAAKIQSKTTFNLVPGTYRLSWRYGKSDAGPDYGVRIGLDTVFLGIILPPTSWAAYTQQYVIAAPTSAKIVFDNTYGAMTGALVDDVRFERLDGPTTVQPDTALNVLGYWQLGEDDPGAAAGGAGNTPTLGRDANGLNPARNLARSGSPTYAAVDGANGSVLAMSFNGSTAGYDLATPLVMDLANGGVEAWVYPGVQDFSDGKIPLIAYNGTPGVDGLGLVILPSGNFGGVFGMMGTFDSGVAATPGAWYHVAVVNNDESCEVYLNGIKQRDEPGGAIDVTGGFAIGHTPGAATNYFNGAVDDVRVFTFTSFDPQDLGINESVSGTWYWSYATTDGPAQSQEVTVSATTGVSGDSTSLPFQLTVNNRNPSGTLSATSPVSEGSTSTASVTSPSDPSAVDAAAGLHFAYDFNNDGVFEVGDGTYAGSGTATSAPVPASFLADGPGTRTIHVRIIDKDNGYLDRTRNITINNAAPTASVSGPPEALAGQLVAFTVGATDPSPVDQAAGFAYSITWGDGSPPEAIARTEGNGQLVARHAYVATGNYTVQVTATDKNSASSAAPGSTSIQINPADAGNLGTILATAPFVELAVADDAALQAAVAAINGLAAPAAPKAITLILGAGPYSGVTLSPPANIILDLAGNDTRSVDGTQIASSTGPAVTVTSGEVYIQGDALVTSANAPAMLVTGGHLTLDQVEVHESPGYLNVAVKVTGGSANLGFDVLMHIQGDGAFVDTYARSALVPHPEGIDAELTPNTYQVTDETDDGTLIHETINAVSLSSTSQTSSALTTSYGESVTFTATIDVKAIEHGLATGTVTFYDGAAVLGTGTVNDTAGVQLAAANSASALSAVGGPFVATFTTSTLSVGLHTITAVYGGDDAYVASSTVFAHTVNNPTAVGLDGLQAEALTPVLQLLNWLQAWLTR